MSKDLQLKDGELAAVREILSRHLPPGVRVSVFGSRAGGRVKPWSDLDLVLEGEAPLSLSLLGRLTHDFDESRLPWKVDIVDRAAISPEFASIVDATKVSFPLSGSSGEG